MTDRNQHVLVRLIPDGECIGIRTFSREIGRRGRFLIIRSSLEEWLCGNRKRAYYDMDCGNILRIRADGHALLFTIFWLASPGKQAGRPCAAVLHSGGAGHCGAAQRSACPLSVYPANESCAHRASKLRQGHAGHMRREAHQACVQQSHARLLPLAGRSCAPVSGRPRDFYFTAQDGLCGGLILHESALTTPHGKYRKRCYSVHT